MQELNAIEVAEISGADRNLGSLYQYTGDPKDATFWEMASSNGWLQTLLIIMGTGSW